MSGFTFGPDNEKLVNSMYYYSYSQPAAAGEKPLIQSGEVDNSYPTVAIGYIQNDTYLPLGFGVIPICSWESFQNDSYWKGTSVVTNLKNNHMCGPFVYISGQNLYPSTVRQILKTYIEVPITIKKTDKGEVEKILNSQGNETGISDSKNILDYVKNNYTNALDTRSNSDDKIYDSALNNKGMFSGNFVDKYIIVKTGDDSYALRTYPAIKITGNLATMPDFVMQFVPTYYSLDDTDPNKTIAYINPDDIMLGNRNKGIYVTDPNIYKKLEKQGLESNEAYGVDGNKITTMDMIQVTGQDEQFTSELGVAAGASVKIMTKSLLEPNNLESSHAAYREFLKDGRIIPEDKAVATRLTNDNGLSQTIDYMKRTSSAQYYLTIGAAVIGVILAIVFIIMIAVKVSKKKKNVNSQTIGGHIKSWFKY